MQMRVMTGGSSLLLFFLMVEHEVRWEAKGVTLRTMSLWWVSVLADSRLDFVARDTGCGPHISELHPTPSKFVHLQQR